MKKVLIILSVFLGLCSGKALAQNFKGYGVIGFNGSHVIGDQMTGYNKPGLLAGLRVAFPFSEKWDLSLGLTYVQKGSRRTYNRSGQPEGGAQVWHLLRTHYVEVPLLFHYGLPFLDERIKLYTGISGARLMGVQLQRFQGLNEDEHPIRPYDLSYHLGGSFAISDNWTFSITNSHSFVSVDEKAFALVFYRWRRGLFHNVLNLEFAYKF